MKKILLNPICYIIIALYLVGCQKDKSIEAESPVVSPSLNTYPTSLATDWQDLHLQLIKTTDGYVPPIAARSLAYINLGLYESTVYGTDKMSLAGKISLAKELPKPAPNLMYNWGIAANAAQYILIKNFFATTSAANLEKVEGLYAKFNTIFKDGENNVIIDRSTEYGTAVANAIWNYSKTDRGHEAFKDVFPTFNIPQGLGMWKPVNNQKALLPQWSQNESLVRANVTTDPPPPFKFSYNSSSDFFKEAKEIYDMSKKLTEDQKAIAIFFADGSGTITPPGHHMNIATEVIKQKNTPLSLAAETYVKMGIAQNDAFIACWRCKYRYNLLRPITYIRETIDKTWTPLVATPPFPEYTSGHSSGAGAAAEILKAQFGENTSFTDNTYTGIYPSREYKNFTDYANETSNSRLYGGIHYRRGCEEGVINGRDIAKNVLKLFL